MSDFKIIYNSGDKIGECTYLSENDKRRSETGNRYAYFKCFCGKEFTTTIAKVKSLHTQSCGCIHKKGLIERNTVHGFANRGKKIKEYQVWIHIHSRCTNPKSKGFKYWGGRGIKMCDRWLHSFERFLEDMGKCPANCRGIDRIDNNGNYEPANCKWATFVEQLNNTSRNVFVQYKGESKTMAQWSRVIDMPYAKLRHRIREMKLSPEVAFKENKI